MPHCYHQRPHSPSAVALQMCVLATWGQRVAVTPMDPRAPVEQLRAAAELQMPFSDTVKYVLLGVSVSLLLLALGILAWQTFRCCTDKHTASTQRDAENSDELDLGAASGAPVMKMEDLSRCLPQVSGSSQAEGDEGEQLGLKKVHGSLRFSVHYDQPRSRLVVTVLQVEGLQEPSQTCRLLPFVKLRLMWAGSDGAHVKGCRGEEEGEGASPALRRVLQEWQSGVVKGGCDPSYGDQFSCVLQQDKDALHHVHLRMEVCNFDRFSRHAVLGEVRVPLGQLNVSYPLELHEDLQIPQKDRVGEVLLSLKFLPTSQRLEVGVLKVRTAPAEICSGAALYVRISVQCNQCKLRSQRTSVAARRRVSVFNEVLMFSLPEFPVEQCKVVIFVYETHTAVKTAKHLLGRSAVGKESRMEDEHWSWMMRSARQPVAQWHSLLI